MIYLFSGPPASGKTTIGKKVSEALKIPYLAKDEIKEILFDNLGIKDVNWSKLLGKTTYDIVHLLIHRLSKLEVEFIIDCNFDPLLATEVFKDISVTEIFITAPEEVLLERFERRWTSGKRHPGHLDNFRIEDLKFTIKNRNKPLNIFKNIIRVESREGIENTCEYLIEQLYKLKLNK